MSRLLHDGLCLFVSLCIPLLVFLCEWCLSIANNKYYYYGSLVHTWAELLGKYLAPTSGQTKEIITRVKLYSIHCDS